MNQKIKIIEREIEKFGKKNDELTCLQRVGKIAELIDELVIFQAASLLGSGQSFIGDLGVSIIEEKLDFVIRDVAQFGNDLRITLTKEMGI